MKVKIIHKDSGIGKNEHDVYDKFIKYLQKEYPLKHNLTIRFLGKREGDMTTGSRVENVLKILSKGRLNRDIMRTLAHEWVHEYQRTILKRPHGPNIGGKNEDEANSESGAVMKKFEQDYPDTEPIIYK